jgi:hypothetical protein
MLALLEDGLHLFGLEIVVGELLGDQVDVLDCLAWVEKEKPISTVVREEFLVCFDQKFKLNLEMVVQD